MDNPVLVHRQADLVQWTDSLRQSEHAGVDTESNGFHAYRERLCLIQVATETSTLVIDPLALDNLDPFADWLGDPEEKKIFHGAEFDVLSLKRDFGFGPRGIFDTMHAARLLGFPKPGLASVAKQLLDLKLDKRYQRHNWGRRPVEAAALAYAMKDVTCLLPLHDILLKRIEEEERGEELAAVCRRLEAMEPKPRRFDPDGFKRLSDYETLDSPARRALRRLFLLREALAEERDLAPFRVLSPATLIQLAQRRPKNLQALSQARGVAGWLVRAAGEALLDELAAASQDTDPGPRPKRRRKSRRRR